MLCTLNRKTADVTATSKDTDRNCVLFFNEVQAPSDPNKPMPMVPYGSVTWPCTVAEAQSYTIGQQYEVTITAAQEK